MLKVIANRMATRHSEKKNKDYQVMEIEFENGYKKDILLNIFDYQAGIGLANSYLPKITDNRKVTRHSKTKDKDYLAMELVFENGHTKDIFLSIFDYQNGLTLD